LISKVLASFLLNYVSFGTLFSGSSKSYADSNEHGNEAEWNVDREDVVEWHKVYIYESGCKENCLSEPFYHVEDSDESNC